MKIIRALSKYVFDNNFTSDRIESLSSNSCFISILDMDNDENLYNKADNFLQVRMWDIEEDTEKYKKPSREVLDEIVNFVNKHIDKKNFIIHCSAGVSRSGAVATYIYDKFYTEVDKETFRHYNKFIQPNLYILNTLKEIDGTF